MNDCNFACFVSTDVYYSLTFRSTYSYRHTHAFIGMEI